GAGGAGDPDQANDIILVNSGTYNSAIQLESGQQLIGQGIPVDLTATLNGQTVTLLAAGAAPTINADAGNTITLGTGNTLRGIVAGSSTGVSITGSGVGTLTVANVSINNGSGRALDLTTSGTLAAAFGSISAAGGTGNGINLVNQTGTLTSGTTSITNPTGTGIHVQGSAGFNFGTTTVNKGTSSGTGVHLQTNTGTTTFGSLAITTNSGTGLFASSAGTVNVGGGAIAATGGPAVDATGTAFSGTGFTSTSSAGSPVSGVSLATVTGTVNLGIGSISKTSGGGTAFSVATSSAIVNYAGSLNVTSGAGVSLTGNSGAMTFSGGMTLSTGANPGFTATGGGTVAVCDENPCNPAATGALVNTITTTTGVALNVNGTTIGSNRLEFRSISAGAGTLAGAGPANGIVLNNTGSSGGLSVTGDGSDTTVGGNSSGGTINNATGADGLTSGAAIYLNNTANVVLRRMTVNGTNQNYGIRGTLVNGFTLEYATVAGTNGTAASLPAPENYGEGAIHFGNATTNGLMGTVTVTKNSVSGGRARNLSIVNTAPGTTTLNVRGNTFGAMQNVVGGNASFAVEARVSSGVTINTTFGGTGIGEGNTLTSALGDLVNFTGQDNTTMDVIMRNNTLSNNHPQNIIGGGSLTLATTGTMTYHVTGNSMRDADGSAVTLFKASPLSGTPSLSGFFANNTIGVAGVVNSGSKTANGIFVSAGGTGTMSHTIVNNAIHQIVGNAHIYADNTGGSYTANFTIEGNTLDTPGANWFAGIAVTNGSPGSADLINVCAKIGGAGGAANTLNLAGGLGIIVGASGAAAGHTFNLPGYVGGANELNVESFLAANNSGLFTTDAYVDAPATAAAFTGTGTTCPTPTS
ncbi:MAG TPA: hypothetical protein VFZ73_02445, partial [Gemmatimonadaceae bacterium]